MRTFLIIIIVGLIISSCKTKCEKIVDTFNNGQTQTLKIYPDCTDTLTFTKRQFYKTGKLATESFHSKDLDYIELKSWFENGQQSAIWKEKNNKEHGHILCWYENGKMKKEGFLNEGQKTGTHKEWHPNGQLQQLGKYIESKPDSIWTFWYENGQVKTLESWDNGVLSGQTKVFYKDGKIEVETFYKNGLKDGEHKQWDKNGILIKNYIIEKDSIIKVLVDDQD